MVTNMSTSTSQDTLMAQMEAMGVQSTTSITTLGAATPFPKENLSNETLELLQKTADTLTKGEPRGRKRLRADTDENDNRASYPQASKAITYRQRTYTRKS